MSNISNRVISQPITIVRGPRLYQTTRRLIHNPTDSASREGRIGVRAALSRRQNACEPTRNALSEFESLIAACLTWGYSHSSMGGGVDLYLFKSEGTPKCGRVHDRGAEMCRSADISCDLNLSAYRNR